MSAVVRSLTWPAALALLGAASLAVMAQQSERPEPLAAEAVAAVRFESLDVIIDSPEPLAAWQFELTDRNGSMLVVGVENGDSPAFSNAPYFDLDAVAQGRAERIVVADFNAAPDAALPSGATRIATVHVRYDAQTDPEYALRLVAAGNAAGESIEAAIRIAN